MNTKTETDTCRAVNQRHLRQRQFETVRKTFAMTTHEYTVASASQLTGARSLPSSPESDDMGTDPSRARDRGDKGQNMLKRRSAIRKGVRFTPSTKSEEEEDANNDSDGLSTHSGTSFETSNSGTILSIPGSVSDSTEERDDHDLEFLLPARYSPQQTGSAEREPSPAVSSIGRSLSHVSVPDRVKEYEAQMTIEHRRRIAKDSKEGLLPIDTDLPSHKRNVSNSSISSRRGRQEGDIYFTPTEVTRSQIFLSSPKGSPTMPNEGNRTFYQDGSQEDEGEEGSHTPRATLSRPPSAIFVGAPPLSPVPVAPRRLKAQKLTISSKQLDQLVTALVKSRLVQKHVRKHWWDSEDIPDDETVVSYTSSVSTPTLTSASTLYSRPNDNFVNGQYFSESGDAAVKARDFATLDSASYENKELPAPPQDAEVPFGGVALADPKIHGSPIRYISRTYRLGANALSFGSCSFLNVLYGSDVECALRIEPASALNKNCKVLLQCVNQVVDRKTGKRSYLLSAEIDVTSTFVAAALAELAQTTDLSHDQIEITTSPTSADRATFPLASPDIDWVALADELQTTAYTTETIDSACTHSLPLLSLSTCTPETLSLLTSLDLIKDQHTDFLLLKPSAYHPNGTPSNIRIPWVSQILYHDWYEKEEQFGLSEAAGKFQRGVVEAVAKRAVRGKEFEERVCWEEEMLGVRCVPLSEGLEGRADLWVAFIQGQG